MLDLFIMLASVTPMEVVIIRLEEELAAFKANPNAINEKKLAMSCQFLVVKVKLGDDGNDPIEEASKMIEKFNLMKKAEDLLTPKEN